MGPKLYNSLSKYGSENHLYEVIEEYNKIGKPQPTKKAKICENESPRKIPLQILFLGIGWLDNNSINWLLL